MKLSDYVCRFLAETGVRHIFMLPGGGAMHLVDSAGRCEGLEFICNLHEQACAIAAEAYARITNILGVALVTSGPGGTNAVTGTLAAWLDSTPCLFISGQVKRSDLAGQSGLRQSGVQEADIVSIVRPITKYAVTVSDPIQIRFHLEKAVYLAKTGRPGPSWIDIPLDVQSAMIDVDSLRRFEPEKTEERTFGVEVAITISTLNESERPIILVGNGVRLAGAEAHFLEMAESFHIPVLTTRLGVDLIPADHELSMGMPGVVATRASNFALQNSDWLLMVGARMDLALMAYAPENLARAAKKIMVNIDDAEIRKLWKIIDVPICMDAKLFITEMLRKKNTICKRDRSSWISRCKSWKATFPFVLPEHHQETSGLSLYAFSDVLSAELANDDVVLPGSSGFAAEIFLTAFKTKAGQRVFHNKGTGAMGFCQPAAIGACLASGRKRTVCVDGDGGFQLNIQELETVRRLHLPIKFFVINNRGYASIRSSQNNYFGRLTGADSSSGLSLPDVLKVADAYDINTVRIQDHRSLRTKIREVLSFPGPVVCDVVVIPDEPIAPRVKSFQRANGSMGSMPLEDMSPLLDRKLFLENMLVPPLND